ncbi:MAG: hypothetical protein ABIQ44_00485 [Chloroflexia bacterium]
MIKGTEIAPGLWALQNSDSERNVIVLFDDGVEGPAAVVDPGDLAVEMDAVDSFAAEMGHGVGVLVFTQVSEEHPAVERWPNTIVISPVEDADVPALPFPVTGWEVVRLSPRRIGLYCKKAGTLLPGLALRNGYIPTLSSGADNYLELLEGVEALAPKMVVPQVGVVALGKRQVNARLSADRDYTQNLTRHVFTAKTARHPLERVKAVARDIYEDYPFVEEHMRNLQRVWDEL